MGQVYLSHRANDAESAVLQQVKRAPDQNSHRRGQTLTHETRRVPFVGSLAFLIFFVGGCGGGSGYNVNNVTVTISPATTMIPKNSQVALMASVNNFCTGCIPQINWSITENNGSPCFWADAKTPPAGPSQGGTIQALGSEGIVAVE
jgi:hypothetical protein